MLYKKLDIDVSIRKQKRSSKTVIGVVIPIRALYVILSEESPSKKHGESHHKGSK